MRLRIVADDLRHRLAHRGRWRINRGGLAHVDERPVGGVGDTGEPAAGLHDGRWKRRGGAGQCHGLIQLCGCAA